jgi:hypothetical protein
VPVAPGRGVNRYFCDSVGFGPPAFADKAPESSFFRSLTCNAHTSSP